MKRTHIAMAVAAAFTFSAPVYAAGDQTHSGAPHTMGSQKSASSDTVRQVQQALQSKGHSTGPIDGILGPNTESALREFQRAQGISVTGRADQQTLASLGVASSGADRSNLPSGTGSASDPAKSSSDQRSGLTGR
jgi:peptidoglycan hydrolase-like protein with peptidoglycan-binding domain